MRRMLIVMVLGAAAAAGCGGGDEPDSGEEARSAARSYIGALTGGDAVKACDQMTAEAQKQAIETVTAAYPDAGDLPCTEAVGDLRADLDKELRRALRKPEIVAVKVDGDRADVTVKGLNRPLRLARVDGEWKVARIIAS
jgi:hypothetical protein